MSCFDFVLTPIRPRSWPPQTYTYTQTCTNSPSLKDTLYRPLLNMVRGLLNHSTRSYPWFGINSIYCRVGHQISHSTLFFLNFFFLFAPNHRWSVFGSLFYNLHLHFPSVLLDVCSHETVSQAFYRRKYACKTSSTTRRRR